MRLYSLLKIHFSNFLSLSLRFRLFLYQRGQTDYQTFSTKYEADGMGLYQANTFVRHKPKIFRHEKYLPDCPVDVPVEFIYFGTSKYQSRSLNT